MAENHPGDTSAHDIGNRLLQTRVDMAVSLPHAATWPCATHSGRQGLRALSLLRLWGRNPSATS